MKAVSNKGLYYTNRLNRKCQYIHYTNTVFKSEGNFSFETTRNTSLKNSIATMFLK